MREVARLQCGMLGRVVPTLRVAALSFAQLRELGNICKTSRRVLRSALAKARDFGATRVGGEEESRAFCFALTNDSLPRLELVGRFRFVS